LIVDLRKTMSQHHMSVSKQEAEFLKSILVKHLDDYVESLVREDKTTDPMQTMQQNRQTGLELMNKTAELIRRASRSESSTFFNT
tara:strand:+ start:5943 stop:6197 length:255 start_codon:yes stop_codon:yes gene_type:complete